jgi:hypothetical protein
MADNYYYGIYRGVCQDNQDPDNTNKIRLTVPQVLNTNWTNWAYPVNPITGNSTHNPHTDSYTTTAATVGTYGSHTHSVTLNSSHSDHIKVPNVGQGVWVMFEGGDVNFPLWIGVY